MREAQTRETRRTVVAAAADLFVERGYASTTIDAVAEHAGVSRKTVFTAVDGGKATLLKLVWDWALAGDDEPVPMAQRPAVRRIQRETDPVVVVRLYARLVREVAERVASLGRVMVVAADVDAEVAQLLDAVEQQRLFGATQFVQALKDRGGLHRGLRVERSAEACWVLMDPGSYLRLVEDRGWTVRDYERWLTQMLTASLLAVRSP